MRSSAAAVVAAMFMAEMTVTFESSMLYAALPTLIRDFGDPVAAGWLLTIHTLIGAAAAVVAGRLGDIFGRRQAILLLLLIATVGSVVSAVSSNFGVVLFGRALQGLSIAVVPLSIGVLRETLPPHRLPVAIGLMTTSQGAGVAIGLVLGGMIVDQLDWHGLFVASALLLALSWLAVRLIVPARPGTPPKEPIDWLEGILPVPSIILILLGISMSKDMGWLDGRVWGAIVAGIVVMVLWIRRSLRAREPFIDLRLLTTRNVALANAISFLLALGTHQMVFIYSTYTQAPAWTMAGLGLTATVAGLAKLPSNILAFAAGPLSGWITQKHGVRTPILIGCTIATAAWFWGMTLPDTLMEVILALCIVSFGTAMLNAAIPNVIVASVPEGRTGEAIGSMSVIRGIGASIGVQVIAVVMASETVLSPDGKSSFPSATGYVITMGWVAALTIAAGATALLLRSGEARQQSAAAA